MPWEPESLVKRKKQLVELVRGGVLSMAEAAEQFGVTPKTGYKWLNRYEADGDAGLEEHSRAPRSSPQAWGEEMRATLLELKSARPAWGPKKLVSHLEDLGFEVPAVSTAGEWLKAANLVKPARRPGPRQPPRTKPLTVARGPNDVWCYDFKGQFRLGDGSYCWPLTVTDDFSRTILGCFALSSTSVAATQPCVERLFREYGLPKVLRSDNGEPFSSSGLAGLTKMNVAWLKQGIELERTRKASPQDNARHERMHRTLKAETTRPPQCTVEQQQRSFDAFRLDFNTVRPHEALGMSVPISRYEPSTRSLLESVSATYPGNFEIRHVRNRGHIKLWGQEVYLTEALIGEHVGLNEVDDGIWQVHFMREVLCGLDMRGDRPKLIGHSPQGEQT